MRTNKQYDVIKCPCCGTEYLPAEIFLPNAFLGKPSNIDKEHITGKITNFYGKTMDTKEHYVCDRCNTPFKISAKIQFFTREDENYNFEEEYTSSLHKPSLFLNED